MALIGKGKSYLRALDVVDCFPNAGHPHVTLAAPHVSHPLLPGNQLLHVHKPRGELELYHESERDNESKGTRLPSGLGLGRVGGVEMDEQIGSLAVDLHSLLQSTYFSDDGS